MRISVPHGIRPAKIGKPNKLFSQKQKGGESFLSRTLCLFLILFPLGEAKPDYQMFSMNPLPYSNVMSSMDCRYINSITLTISMQTHYSLGMATGKDQTPAGDLTPPLGPGPDELCSCPLLYICSASLCDTCVRRSRASSI